MSKIKDRDIATSLVSAVFIVIGTTGVMMYFHILDSYTKNLHETIGLFFVLAVGLHIYYNWNSMRNYFGKKVFLISLLAIFLVSSGFVIATSSGGTSPKKAIIEAVLKLPIKDATTILGSNTEDIKSKLQKQNISFDQDSTILQISKKNKISPFEVVGIIINK